MSNPPAGQAVDPVIATRQLNVILLAKSRALTANGVADRTLPSAV
jgi:hypothetical protein